MSLVEWSWAFLVLYVGGMLLFGYVASRRIKSADDFATARSSYGPFFLAIAFAASTASGATFLGSPGLSYEYGFASLWAKVLYPVGVYFGVLISMRLIATAGHRFGNRSIPEYLGDRYQSEGIRVLVSIFSLMLCFYLAGQLISGLVMFEAMLGLSKGWALLITTVVLGVYVTAGGAHADILTDGVQGGLMVVIGALVFVMFLLGTGVDGGLSGLVVDLRHQDPDLVGLLNESTALYHSWWSIAAILLAHIPLGLLPHLGNKLWALRGNDRFRFLKLAFGIGLTMSMIGLGGLLARAILGDALLAPGESANQALPLLFIELFPAWLAALIGVGILSAIMSTADGLVVSSTQIVANDLYRRSIVPRLKSPLSEAVVDRQVLLISRFGTVVVLAGCAGIAWALLDVNISLVVWIGSGAMMAAFAGPLIVGALWRGVTRAGAYAGLVSGMLTFVLLHSGSLDPEWFYGTPLFEPVRWLKGEAPNPFSCAALGEAASVIATFVVSRLSKPLPDSHIDELFGSREALSGVGADGEAS